MKKGKLLCSNYGVISLNSNVTLTDSASNYDAILIQLWVHVGNTSSGSRKFFAYDTRMETDKGSTIAFIEGSVYYNTSYNACVGLTLSSDAKTLTVKELSMTGYQTMCIGAIYGLKFT